jgi:hypothetical protein
MYNEQKMRAKAATAYFKVFSWQEYVMTVSKA